MVLAFLCSLLLISSDVSIADNVSPEQLHVALAGSNAFRVCWFTKVESKDSICKYGIDKDDLSALSNGIQRHYLDVKYGSHHVAMLNNLESETEYFYSCGDGLTMSPVKSFLTPTAISSKRTLSFAIFGDMGFEDSLQRPMGELGDLGDCSLLFMISIHMPILHESQ